VLAGKLQDVVGRVIVDMQGIERLTVPGNFEGGEVYDAGYLIEDIVKRGPVRGIGLDEAKPWVLQVWVKIGHAAHRQVIDADDPIVVFQQFAEEVRAEKPGYPGYENDWL
jgi:hypothetical protein